MKNNANFVNFRSFDDETIFYDGNFKWNEIHPAIK